METSEDVFIKDWKMFYDNDHSVVNYVAEKRMRFLLEEYRKTSNPYVIKVIEEKQVPVERIVYIEGNIQEVINQEKTATPKDLNEVAESICDKHKISITTLRRIGDKTRTRENVDARIDFVKTLRSKFYCSVTELGKYLNLDHTTIVHYKNYLK